MGDVIQPKEIAMNPMSKTVMTLLAGYALWRLGGDWRQHQLQRQQARPLAKPREETRWEGEGGALPDGPQTQVGQVGQVDDDLPGTRH